MSKIEWQSALTYDDVKHLPYEVKEQLIDELNLAVATICISYAVPNFDEPIEEEKE